MCLAVPGKIVELAGETAVADLHGNRVSISTVLTPEVTMGDWVLVHAGFSIQKLDAEAAAETFAILKDVERNTKARSHEVARREEGVREEAKIEEIGHA